MSDEPRTIRVDYLARVEGEGALTIRLAGGKAERVELSIFEPPRFFEALLRGRHLGEAPDITSRICGICPVAYLTSACNAIEDALGVRVEGQLRALRRLLYCGEWIESHALHVFLLHAPDFLGYPDAVTMARDHKEWVVRGLAMKKAGNAIVALLGGREIHPVNVRVGGFYRAPTAGELEALLPGLERALEDAHAALRWAAGFTFPELQRDYELVALQRPDEYAVVDGRVVSSKGLDVDVHEYEAHFAEEHVPWSSALRSRHVGRGSYLCGPLARFNLNFDRLGAEAQRAARSIGLEPPCHNPFKSLLVRLVEIIQATDEAIGIIRSYARPAAPFVEAPARAGTRFGAREAPRGRRLPRYALAAEGTITEAKIVPPTSQNQAAIEEDLRDLAPELARRPLAEATVLAEQAVRSYDPCISCATHFLELRIEGT